MGWYEAAKDAISMAQKADNVDLLKQILEMQKSMQEMQQENFQLKEENAALLEKLNLKARVKFDGKVYWDGEEGPFCTLCWENNQKLIHVIESKNDWDGARYYRCPNNDCSFTILIEKGKAESSAPESIW